MHFGDSIFIFLLALVLFGPKKLPEIGKQIGKLLAEFRRASNEFKFQIQEEIRNMEDDERRKKLAEAQAQTKVAEQQVQALPTAAAPTPAGRPFCRRQTGVTVSQGEPFASAGAPNRRRSPIRQVPRKLEWSLRCQRRRRSLRTSFSLR